MMQLYTENNLIQFIYNELSADDAATMEQLINSNSKLKDQYNKLSEAKDMVDDVVYTPSQTSLDIIMNHARSAEMEATH